MYHLLVIIVALLAIVRGYRRGLTGQVTSVLGLAFGVVCCHIFIPGMTGFFDGWHMIGHFRDGGEYLTSNLSGAIIFFGVYFLFRSITGILRKAADQLGTSLLDSIIGAVFCLYNYLLMLSIAFNVAVGWNTESSLMHDGRSDDGNLVNIVLRIGPAALGSVTFGEFSHEMQLRDARKISCNLDASSDVVNIELVSVVNTKIEVTTC